MRFVVLQCVYREGIAYVLCTYIALKVLRRLKQPALWFVFRTHNVCVMNHCLIKEPIPTSVEVACACIGASSLHPM